jgi:hypothetical protein
MLQYYWQLVRVWAGGQRVCLNQFISEISPNVQVFREVEYKYNKNSK